MTLWRIRFHATLDGAGGIRTSGRWHTAGRPVVYCGPHPAVALVEVLVHIEIDSGDLPEWLSYLEIEAPDDLSAETVDTASLPGDWRNNQYATRVAGDEWLRKGSTALLRVPSVVVPATWNVLINPRHPGSRQIRIVRVHRHAIDPRLLR